MILDRLWGLFAVNWVTKLVSILVAVVIWGVVLGSRVVEVTKEIAVEVVTAPDVIPANEIPDKVQFRLAGPKAFLRTIIDRREDPIRINLTAHKSGMVNYRFLSDNVHLPIGIKVLSITPAMTNIKLEALKRTDVPVRVEFRGSPPEGYRLSRFDLAPQTVRVRGPESKVEAVTEIATVPIDISTLRQNLQKELTLDLNRYGVQLDSPAPKISIVMDAVSANFKIKSVDIRVLSPYKFTMNEKTATVWIRATPKDLKELDRSKVYGLVDLRGKPKGNYTENIKVVMPESIGLVKVLPEKVKITLW